MRVTFSNIENVEKYAKNANIFICLAESERHPCKTKRFETEWAKKDFRVCELNDRGVDHRYKHVTYDDVEKLAQDINAIAVIDTVMAEESWIHINCLAGYSRSAAVTILALMVLQPKPPTLKDYQKYYGEVRNGVHRLPTMETEPNHEICKFIRQYFNLEVVDGEFSK